MAGFETEQHGIVNQDPEEQETTNGVQVVRDSKVTKLKWVLALTCLLLIGAVAAIVVLAVFLVGANSGSNSSVATTDTTQASDIPAGYILDGPVWHTVFFRMQGQSGIAAAQTYCRTFKTVDFPAVSVHCGVQNSIEQVSFGPHGTAQDAQNRSLEYGFAFTFATVAAKDSTITTNAHYTQFRTEMDIYRDEASFPLQDLKGIWVFDWVHGETNRANQMAYSATPAIAEGSTWHFVFFRWKTDEYTWTVTPTLIDSYRNLANTMTAPYDSSKLIATSFSFGILNSGDNFSFGPHNGTVFDRSTEYGHCQSYETLEDKEFMVGAGSPVITTPFDMHHDLFKAMVGGLHWNGTHRDGFFFSGIDVAGVDDFTIGLEGVFVFDFNDEVLVWG